MPVPSPKSYFSETEAARSLGISVEEFRNLLQRHIVDREEDMNNVAVTTFHASDVLLLRMLIGHRISSTAVN